MTNRSTDQTAEAPKTTRPQRGPWLAIGIAVVALISIVSGELWALRQTPPDDNAATPTVASGVERALARVAATSSLIGPMN